MDKHEQAKRALEYTKSLLNSISVVGVESCNKMTIAYNNIDVLFKMVCEHEKETNDSNNTES